MSKYQFNKKRKTILKKKLSSSIYWTKKQLKNRQEKQAKRISK